MQLVPGRTYLIALYEAASRARSIFRQELIELLNPANSAGSLAAAFALGTLISFIPVPVLDTMMAGAVLVRFKQVNRAALLMARLLWNDLLVFPLYGSGYRLGSSILAPHKILHPEITGLPTAFSPVLGFALGNVIIALGMAAAGYLLFFAGVRLFHSANSRDNRWRTTCAIVSLFSGER